VELVGGRLLRRGVFRLHGLFVKRRSTATLESKAS
jgi:hypothetical protein